MLDSLKLELIELCPDDAAGVIEFVETNKDFIDDIAAKAIYEGYIGDAEQESVSLGVLHCY
jgi:hypothetical protein